ncbi:MAG: Blue-light-activated protein [Syntrophorhabdus sp. PtaU1.Bin002]|nr:MAG: Blue-light-activated protein [Syntrophorhabdus sp. PtaU1.Bin002]
MVTDMTNVRETETKSAKEGEKFQILADYAPFGMVLIAKDGTFKYMNPKFKEFFGYDLKDTPNGRTWFSKAYPEREYREWVLSKWIEDMKSAQPGEKKPRTFAVVCKDGTTKIINFISVMLNAGETIMTCENITERVKAQEELSEEKERLAVTLRSIGDGVMAMDTEGRITLMNAVAERFSGWTQQEALGRNIEEVFHAVNGKTRKKGENPVERVRGISEAVDLADHQVLISRGGKEMLISATIAPIFGKDGSIIGAVLVFRDITEKRKVEEDLLRMDKLESVGVLAGGIAHDFNNVLSVILGNISLARMYAKPDDEKLQKRFRDAEQAVSRAKDLTQQLLTFSKGGSPVKRTSAVQSVLKASCRFAVTGSNIQCDFNFPDNLLPVDIDAGQINQVINNIIINAQQAMPEGGTIQVGAENIVSSGIAATQGLILNKGEYVRISITDHGTGIPTDRLSKIFDPYFTTKEKGTGLGLATCHSIIKKHGGYITVESVVGQGTTFYIYLPASQRGETAGRRERQVPAPGKGKKILVMDDEDMIRAIVGEMLDGLGYRAELAKNGNEAIDLYRKARESGEPFDAVILDLTVPGGMGGKETIKGLLGLDPKIKAIVSSGYSNDPIMAEFREYGFEGVITKPYKLTELGEILHSVLTGIDTNSFI